MPRTCNLSSHLCTDLMDVLLASLRGQMIQASSHMSACWKDAGSTQGLLARLIRWLRESCWSKPGHGSRMSLTGCKFLEHDVMPISVADAIGTCFSGRHWRN